MRRSFLEEPSYKCKSCGIEMGVPTDISSRIYLGPDRLFCVFTRTFNTYLVPSGPGFIHLRDVHCVKCRSLIGHHWASIEHPPASYYILRHLLHGPEGSDDDGF